MPGLLTTSILYTVAAKCVRKRWFYSTDSWAKKTPLETKLSKIGLYFSFHETNEKLFFFTQFWRAFARSQNYVKIHNTHCSPLDKIDR